MKNLYQTIRIFKRTFLLKKSTTIFSQFGEDAVLRHAIKDRDGFYVDVGCWHPIKFSNTWLLYRRGWRGINIDLGETKIKSFNLARRDDINIIAAVSDSERDVTVEADKDFSVGEQILPADQQAAKGSHRQRTMRTRTLTDIIGRTKYKDRKIDLLTIDAEGHDLHVLQGLDFDIYEPKIILVESFLQTVGDVLKSETNALLLKQGYHLFNWVGLTLFYKKDGAAWPA